MDNRKSLLLACMLGVAAAGCGADTDGDGSIIGATGGTNSTGAATGGAATNGGVNGGGINGGVNGGTAGGSTGTATGGGASAGTGDDCEEHIVSSMPAVPDILIVLDRSSSMTQEGRWDPSRSALINITAKLTQKIRFGLMTFPGASGQECGPGTLDVPIDSNNAAQIGTFLNACETIQSTPTPGALASALTELKNTQPPIDGNGGPQFVLLVTDGSPTCDASGVFGGGQGGGGAAVQDSYAGVDALREAGYPTYVVGYDTKSDPQLATVLDEMARRGGTGDTAHRAVEDEASLAATLEAIAGNALSCRFTLDEAPDDPTFVRVKVDGAQVNYNDPNGWQLDADGKTVVLQGAACMKVQDGKAHTLEVAVACTPVNPV